MLIGIVVTLITIGCIFIYSSSSVFALERYKCPYYFLQKQLIGLLVGSIGCCFFALLSFKRLKQLVTPLFWTSWLLTLCTLLPKISRTIHGSSRWIAVGPLSLQPSDLLKLSFILLIARFIEKKNTQLHDLQKTLIPLCIIIGITSMVLLRQPDFGLTVTLATTAFLMIFIAGLPLRYIGMLIGSAVPLLLLLILAFPYRLKRVLIFLDPWKDPKGAGFQIIQSLIAIGSGGWLGVGIGASKQKFFYLPMQHTDFIFSIIAEETGYLGSTIIIGLYVSFLYYGFKIALQLEDLFSRFAVLGFTLIITIQAVINIFVTIGLLPTKGIGLPFISYGNSALVCSLCILGCIISIVKNRI